MECAMLKTVVAALAISLPGLLKAADSSPPPRIVELFTSQGCSSCPPADALLGALSGMPNVVALAFHVDYWDDLGWRDRFSMADATRRQNSYVDALNLPSAFTPQMIIDGRASFVGSDRRRVLSALATAAAAQIAAAPIAVRLAGGELTVSLADGAHQGSYDVELAALLPQASTAIGRGENSGQTLTEYNIVRQFRRLGSWEGRSITFQVPLASLPPDATRAIVLLQRKGLGVIEGVASIDLR
jgi:hypothetical protein